MFISLFTDRSDLIAIAALFAIFAIIGVGLSILAWHFLFHNVDQPTSDLIETVEKSIFAFVVFLLAITLADVRTNFAKTNDNVIMEAAEISHFYHDLELESGESSKRIRHFLLDYARNAVAYDWKSLGAARPHLSSQATASIDTLRYIVRDEGMKDGFSEDQKRHWRAVTKLDDLRQARLQNATASAPHIFWIVTGILIVIGSMMTGRKKPTLSRLFILSCYFGALGMIVSLITIFDEPFSGETSVSPAPIVETLKRLESGMNR